MSDSINWSTLKHLATSARLLKWRREHPQPETAALRLGRAIHCAILEPEEFEGRWKSQGSCSAKTKAGGPCGSSGSLYLDGAWYCKVRGHAPAGAGNPPKGLEVITPEERDLVNVCAASVMDHAVARNFLRDGTAEESLEWVNPGTGAKCRGRLDYIRPRGIVDVKSSHADTVRGFTREAAQRLYHGQMAWYHDGAIEAGRIPKDADRPTIIHVSTTEPYDVAVYRMTDISYQAGQILYTDLLKRYIDCDAADWWPGIAPDLVELDLPAWAGGMQGSEEPMEAIL